ncbi:MAG: GtrA family protein [Vibrionaceae bacterium]
MTLMTQWIADLFQLRLVRFGFSGALATLTHVSVAFAVLYFGSSSTFIANVAGFSCAFGLSYYLQSYFVFKQKASTQNAWRFFVVQVGGLLIAQLISEFLHSISPYLRVVVVVGLIPLVTYFLHRIWTYSSTSK